MKVKNKTMTNKSKYIYIGTYQVECGLHLHAVALCSLWLAGLLTNPVPVGLYQEVLVVPCNKNGYKQCYKCNIKNIQQKTNFDSNVEKTHFDNLSKQKNEAKTSNISDISH